MPFARLAIALLLAAVASAQEPVSLRLNLQTGETYPQRVATKQVINQSLLGMEQTTETGLVLEYDFTVTKVDPATGVATLDAVYRRVAMEFSSPMLSMAYDSAAPPAEIHPALRPYAALVGASFTMDIAPDGTVPRVDGVDETVDAVLESADIPEGMRRQLEGQIREQFNDEAVRRLTEQTLAIYPESPVAVGESWSKRIDGAGMIPVVIDNTWTLKQADAANAGLAVESQIASAEGESLFEANGMTLKGVFEGSQAGTIDLDRVTGWIRRGELQQKLTGTVSIGGEAAGAMTIPMTMTTVVTIDGGK